MAEAWSKWVEEAGLRARLFRWPDRDFFYYDFTDGLSGKRVRRSTKRTDRKQAEGYVKDLLRAIAEEGQGHDFGRTVDLQTVFKLFFAEKALSYSAQWQKACETRRDLFVRAWGASKPVDDIGQADVDRFRDLRMSGDLAPEGSRTEGVREPTVEADLRWLSTVFNWAHGRKVNGRRLVTTNPLTGLERPSKEKGVRRPVASHERFLKTLAKADEVDSEGRLGCMLSLARYTGRRENAICCLRANDFLRSPDAVRAVIAEMGLNEADAEHYPFGAIRWRAEHDKQGLASLTPLSGPARAALDAYLERNPRLGDVPLFPAPGDDSKSIRRDLAGDWLVRAEKLAGLPKLRGTRWHGYRRLFATELKALPLKDVAAAGGWSSTETVQRIYQQAEAEGVLSAVQAVGK